MGTAAAATAIDDERTKTSDRGDSGDGSQRGIVDSGWREGERISPLRQIGGAGESGCEQFVQDTR